MKKILLFVALFLISAVAMAQKDVTKFLGFPVDGSVSEMVQKLNSKGFTKGSGEGDYLTGRFNGHDVRVYIVTNNDKVYRIMVCDANSTSETNIKVRFNNLCEQFKNNAKYFSLAEDDQKIPADEDIEYEMTVHKKRYEAVFYQYLDTTSAEYKEGMQALLSSKYSEEQLENPSEEVQNDINQTILNFAYERTIKKPVWFMISENYGEYSIVMFYDNMYNMANGEDL